MKARMGHSPARSRIGAALIAAAILAPGVRARAESYTVTPIAPRAVGSHHYSINDRGQVAGWVNVSGTNRAFRWTPTVANGATGVLVTLQSGSANTAAYGMSSLGDVVGVHYGRTNESLLWPAAGGVVNLGTGGGTTWREAWAVNASGDVAISQNNSKSASSTGTFIARFVNGKQKLYRVDASPTKVMDLNDSGQVVAYSFAQLWTPTSSTTWSLQNLLPSGGTGHDLNENGDVIGQAPNSEGRARPLLYVPAPRYGLAAGINDLWNTVVVGLGSPAAGEWRSGHGFGVNDLGVVVGQSTAQDSSGVTDRRAWIWDHNSGARDLSALVAPTGWTLTNGWHRINNAGQIVTTATDGTGEYCVLLTPNP